VHGLQRVLRRPDPAAEEVADLVAGDGGDRDERAPQRQRQVRVAALGDQQPAVNSSESPGRKDPISSPDSAKTIARMPSTPKVRATAGRGHACGER